VILDVWSAILTMACANHSSLCYSKYRALAQKSAVEAINSKVSLASVPNHTPQS